MRLREFMRTDVLTVEPGEAAGAAWSRMRQRRIRHLVVVTDGGKLTGVVSERDLGGQEGARVRQGKTVRDLMSPKVVSVPPTATLRQAANLMRGRVVGALPVVEDDRLVGIVTATDVLDELGRGMTGLAVGERGRPVRAAPSSRRKSNRNPTARKRSRPTRDAAADGQRPRTPDSEARAPLPGWTPRASKRELGQAQPVPAHIRAEGVKLSPADRAYLRRRLGMKFGKFSLSIERVTVRVRDVNGPRGGVDKVCRIKVVLPGLPSVVYESRGASHRVAINRALDGAERAVRRALGRRRTKPHRTAA
jgi:CBS domain-containing protein